MVNKKEIVISREEGKKETVIIKKPTSRQESSAKIEAASYIADLLSSGKKLMPRSKMREYIEEQNLWGKNKSENLRAVNEELAEGEEQLKRGGRKKDGSKFSKEEAKQLSIKMRVLRYEQLTLVTEHTVLFEDCLENVNQNRRFDYLVSVCCLKEDGSQLFNNLNHYLDEAGEEYAQECANGLRDVIYSEDEKWTLDLPETKFLINYGFANEEGELLDNDGNVMPEDFGNKDEIEFVDFEDETPKKATKTKKK